MTASDGEHGRKVYNSGKKEAAPRARPLLQPLFPL